MRKKLVVSSRQLAVKTAKHTRSRLLPTAYRLLPTSFYQSLYFSPFNAVSVDLERTSKTFSPPQEAESFES